MLAKISGRARSNNRRKGGKENVDMHFSDCIESISAQGTQFQQLFSELSSVSPNHLALDGGMAKVQRAGFNLSNAALLKRARTAAMEDVKFG